MTQEYSNLLIMQTNAPTECLSIDTSKTMSTTQDTTQFLGILEELNDKLLSKEIQLQSPLPATSCIVASKNNTENIEKVELNDDSTEIQQPDTMNTDCLIVSEETQEPLVFNPEILKKEVDEDYVPISDFIKFLALETSQSISLPTNNALDKNLVPELLEETASENSANDKQQIDQPIVPIISKFMDLTQNTLPTLNVENTDFPNSTETTEPDSDVNSNLAELKVDVTNEISETETKAIKTDSMIEKNVENLKLNSDENICDTDTILSNANNEISVNINKNETELLENQAQEPIKENETTENVKNVAAKINSTKEDAILDVNNQELPKIQDNNEIIVDGTKSEIDVNIESEKTTYKTTVANENSAIMTKRLQSNKNQLNFLSQPQLKNDEQATIEQENLIVENTTTTTQNNEKTEIVDTKTNFNEIKNNNSSTKIELENATSENIEIEQNIDNQNENNLQSANTISSKEIENDANIEEPIIYADKNNEITQNDKKSIDLTEINDETNDDIVITKTTTTSSQNDKEQNNTKSGQNFAEEIDTTELNKKSKDKFEIKADNNEENATVTTENKTQNTKSNNEIKLTVNNISEKSMFMESDKSIIFNKILDNTTSQLKPQVKADVMNQISANLTQLSTENTKINMVLRPESIGKLSVELQTGKDGLIAKFIAETPQVKDILDKSMDTLKNTLTAQGVSVNNIVVKVESSGTQMNNGMTYFEQENFDKNMFANSQKQNQSEHKTENQESYNSNDSDVTLENGTEETDIQEKTETQRLGQIDYRI